MQRKLTLRTSDLSLVGNHYYTIVPKIGIDKPKKYTRKHGRVPQTETVQVESKKQNSNAFLILYTEEITVDKVLINISIQKATALKVANSHHCPTSLIQKKLD